MLKGETLRLEDGMYSFGVRPYVSIKTVTVGKLLMPPIQVPVALKRVYIRQYRIPGGHKEIGDTIKDLIAAGVVRPITTSWNNPVWPVKKSDGTWRMTVDYRELNSNTPPLTAAVPDMVTLIENIQRHPGNMYAVIDLANALYTIPIGEQCQEQFAYTWQGWQFMFTRLPMGYVHSPTICHRIVAEHMEEVTLPPNVQVTHYIDDIMIQGPDEQVVQQVLEQVITHLKKKGWEINPAKIQGPGTSVQFLGIQWTNGRRDITPKAKQKIVEFTSPKTKKEAQRFIGLFGFWRQHIPHLSQILAPIYKVTRKKYSFEWGSKEELAFETAKQAIQMAMDLWPVKEGPIDLNVSVHKEHANWSLWQKQGRGKVPLGFWTRKLPEAGDRYTPFERQLCACYWALVETEELTLGHDVFLRPEIPIMNWVMGSPKTHKIGHAQESSIIKWKWYIQNRAKTGPKGVAALHEKVAEQPLQGTAPIQETEESLVKWGVPYDQLSEEQQAHAWFTGSAKYVGSQRSWKAVAYNPVTKQMLVSTGKNESSQYAELVAVHQAIACEQGECHVYTDSWSVANGLATWLPTWERKDYQIYSKEVWGKQIWQELSKLVREKTVTIYHVDAHTNQDSLEQLFNSIADEAAKVSTVESEDVDEEADNKGVAQWAHQKSGHLGERATHRWALQRGIRLSMEVIKTEIANCPVCQHVRKRQIPGMVQGHIKRGKLPGQIWQIDFIGPLPSSKGCQYVCTAVDTYSGYLIAHPCKQATQINTIKTLELITKFYGTPLQIQSDNGTHFTGHMVQGYSAERYIQWIYHIPYYPQAAGLIERMNGLLKQQLKKLGDGTLQKWRDHLEEAINVLNNRPITDSETPLSRMISRQEDTECRDQHAVVTCWETSPGGLAPDKLLPPSGGTYLTIQDQVTISPESSQTVSTGIGVQIPDKHVGFIVPMPSLIVRGISIVEKTLDPGRTEEVKLTLLNRGKEQGDMSALEVVAKLIVTPTCNSEIAEQETAETRGRVGIGAKVWLKQEKGPPPVPTEVIAKGDDNVVIVVKQGSNDWLHVPAGKCYLRN
ncbi:uncharacterized protein LOC128656897 [Bombina bombina]|uniref:uncharacterized protein LOC128656897 n=1 Tax=Bombina bombina TaxID=8345 RepID=UPI00235B241E|nr:uncharacterized protein LOC128656897 [Bombina bombina]